MIVKAALLCDFAEVREGLLIVVSGGITRLWRQELGNPLAAFLALVIEVPAAERPVPHELAVTVTGPADQQIAVIRGGFQVASGDFDPDEAAFVNLPFDLRPVGLPAFGWYTVAIDLDGVLEGSLRFKVVQGVAAAQVPPPSAGRGPRRHN